MNTTIQKNYQGKWEAKTTHEMVINEKKAQLNITTSVNNAKRLITTASVGWVKGNCVSHTVFEDYYANIWVSEANKATSKLVMEQHNKVLLDMNDIVQEVQQFYKDKESSNA